MELLKMICEKLNIVIGKEWEGYDGYKYKICEDGEIYYLKDKHWINGSFLYKYILTGVLYPKNKGE